MELQVSSKEIGDFTKEGEGVFEIILLRNKENDKFGKEEDKSFEEQNMKNMLQYKHCLNFYMSSNNNVGETKIQECGK
jgi:hypothetical protein